MARSLETDRPGTARSFRGAGHHEKALKGLTLTRRVLIVHSSPVTGFGLAILLEESGQFAVCAQTDRMLHESQRRKRESATAAVRVPLFLGDFGGDSKFRPYVGDWHKMLAG